MVEEEFYFYGRKFFEVVFFSCIGRRGNDLFFYGDDDLRFRCSKEFKFRYSEEKITECVGYRGKFVKVIVERKNISDILGGYMEIRSRV